MKMRTASVQSALISLALIAPTVVGAEGPAGTTRLELKATLGVALQDDRDGHAGITRLVWVNERTLVFAAADKVVSRWEIGSAAVAWSRTIGPMRGLAGPTAGGDVLLLAENDHKDLRLSRINTVGEVTSVLTRDQLAALANLEYPLPDALTWCPRRHCAILSLFSSAGGEPNVVSLEVDPPKLVGAWCIYAGGGFFLSCSDSVAASGTGNAYTVFDPSSGEVRLQHVGRTKVPTDLPFVSSVHDLGAGMVAVATDNSWSTGRIEIVDVATGKTATKFDAEHGHICVDADSTHGVLAVSGNHRVLSLYDRAGEKMASVPDADLIRTLVVAFSPSGDQIAVGGSDSSVRVYGVHR